MSVTINFEGVGAGFPLVVEEVIAKVIVSLASVDVVKDVTVKGDIINVAIGSKASS